MCMSCNNTGKPLKKIMLFLAIAIGIGAATYFIFATTNNPAIAASIPLIMSFAACPLMCVIMGGLMVVMNRSKKRKEVTKERANPKENMINQLPAESKQSVLEHLQNFREKTTIEKETPLSSRK